jgi:rubredoxin
MKTIRKGKLPKFQPTGVPWEYHQYAGLDFTCSMCAGKYEVEVGDPLIIHPGDEYTREHAKVQCPGCRSVSKLGPM